MITVNYKDVLHEDMPVDAQQVITGIDLVVAGDLAGVKPELIRDNSSQYFNPYPTSYTPLPAVVKYRDPLHSEYNFLKTVKLADYFDPFLPAPDVLGDGIGMTLDLFDSNYQPGDGTQIMDGDDITYLENKAGWAGGSTPPLEIMYEYLDIAALAGKIIGWKMVYSANFDDAGVLGGDWPRVITMSHFRDPPGSGSTISGISKTASWRIENTLGDLRDIYAVFLPQIHMDEVNALPLSLQEDWQIWNTRIRLHIDADHMPSIGSFKLFHFYPLVLNESNLETIAKSEIVLPALRPGRLYVKGYVATDSAVTVEGFPGGNIVAVTKGFEYIHTREEGMLTIISLEQDSIMSEADYGQRRRAIDEMVNRKISNEGYSVLMGERL